MNVRPSSTTVSSCVLTPLVASRANALLGLPSTTLPASVSRRKTCEGPSFPLRSSFPSSAVDNSRPRSARGAASAGLRAPGVKSLTLLWTSLGQPSFPTTQSSSGRVTFFSPAPPDNNECTSDINLCGSKGVCQNTPGSFTCECQRGFSLDQSGASCEGRCSPQLRPARSALQRWPPWLSAASVSCKNYLFSLLGVVVHICHPSTWGSESGGLPQVGGQPKIKSK